MTHLQSPTGLADGLEVGVLYQHSAGFAPASARLAWVPRIASGTKRTWRCLDYARRERPAIVAAARTYDLFTTFLRLDASPLQLPSERCQN